MYFKIITLGCKINSYESEAIREELLLLGHKEISEKSHKHADYTFINTCAVTNQSERKCTKLVHHVYSIDPKSKLIIFGCSSQIHKEYYLKEKNVIAVFGSNKKEIINNFASSKKDNVINTRNFSFDQFNISTYIGQTRANVKIQDGCDNFCSYCIVPFTRGKSRSRDKDSILSEIQHLLDNNFKEIILAGIDVSDYNLPSQNNYNLTALIKDILNKFESYDFRLRISSIEISKIDDEYISLFHNKKLCPHFHIPLQSGSPKILALMNRKYDLDYFKNTMEKIRKVVKNVAFSTDIIAGFPSESEDDFNKTYNFLLENKFMRIHAFPYSERPFTKASLISDGIVDMSIRKERVRKLIALSNKLDNQFRKSLSGDKVTVLIDHKDNKGYYTGYSENYLEFKIPSKKNIIGQFVNLNIDL